MGPIGWAIALVILNAVIGMLAKKAQEKRNLEARRGGRPAGAAGSPPPQSRPTARGEMQPARGEMQPARGEMQPARGEMQPARGEMQPARGGTQPARIVVRPPTAPPNRAVPPMVQRGGTPADPAAAMAKAVEDARTAAQARAAREARAVERARAESSQRNRAGVNSARGQVRTVQPSKERFSVTAKDGRRGAVQKAARPVVPPPPEQREEYAALQSTKRVRESLEKVRAAERRVGGGQPTAALGSVHGAGGARKASPRAASLRALLASPERIREGVVFAELLGPPRSMRPI